MPDHHRVMDIGPHQFFSFLTCAVITQIFAPPSINPSCQQCDHSFSINAACACQTLTSLTIFKWQLKMLLFKHLLDYDVWIFLYF